MSFQDLGIDQDIVDALAERGIEQPFPIQSEAIPLALAGNDVIGQARTGTGKTLGFGLPLLQAIGNSPEKLTLALVVVPTRELAIQVASDLELAASKRPTKVLAIYGGKAYEGQIRDLEAGVQVVVGTPGRLIDLANQKKLNLKNVKFLVLDEADEMLDLGFLPDVERIFNLLPEVRQTMLFSATMPSAILTLARKYQNRPVHIRISDPEEGKTKADIKQFVYRAHSLDKDEVVGRILQAEGRGKTVIFVKTKRQSAKLTEELVDRGFIATPLHGDMSQEARERSMQAFRSGKKEILVATEVAARGIDVDDVTHVINYSVPEDEKAYTHRIGRTGRAGRIGIAVTFVDWDDMPRWEHINRELEIGVPEPVETYSNSPQLFSDLGIPAGTKGRLSRKSPATGIEGESRPASARNSSHGGNRNSGSSKPQAGQRSGQSTGQPTGQPTGQSAGEKTADGVAGSAKTRTRRRNYRSQTGS